LLLHSSIQFSSRDPTSWIASTFQPRAFASIAETVDPELPCTLSALPAASGPPSFRRSPPLDP